MSINTHMKHIPTHQTMHVFGSNDLTNSQKGLTLVGTIAATYACLYYLPPNMNQWAAGATILTGATYFFCGSFSKILEYISGLFNSPSSSGKADMWGGEKNDQLRVGSKTSGTRPSMKKPGGTPSHTTPPPSYTPPPQHHAGGQHGTVVKTGEGVGTVTPGSYNSGARPKKK